MARIKKPIARNFDAPLLCSGKRRYRTRHEAEMVVDEKTVLQPELELNIYRCLSCGDFHLTRIDPSK